MSKLLKIWLGFILVVGTLERFEVSAAAIAAQDDEGNSEASKALKQDDDAAKDSRKKRDLIIPRPYPAYGYADDPAFYGPSTYLTNAATNYYPSAYPGLPRYSSDFQQIADYYPPAPAYYPAPAYDPFDALNYAYMGNKRLLGRARKAKLRRLLTNRSGMLGNDDGDGGLVDELIPEL